MRCSGEMCSVYLKHLSRNVRFVRFEECMIGNLEVDNLCGKEKIVEFVKCRGTDGDIVDLMGGFDRVFKCVALSVQQYSWKFRLGCFSMRLGMLNCVKEITKLDLYDCDDFTFVKRMGKLESFKLENSRAPIDMFLNLSSNMKELVLDTCVDNLDFIVGLPNLIILRLNGCEVKEFDLIGELVKLRELEICYCEGLKDVSFSFVNKLRNLCVLNVSGTTELSGWINLRNCRVEKLVMEGRPFCGEEFVECFNLKSLNLGNTRMLGECEQGFQRILQLCELEELVMWNCRWINNEFLANLGQKLRGLRVLNICGCEITSVGAVVGCMFNLEVLEMRNVKVQEVDFMLLRKLVRIRRLGLDYAYHRVAKNVFVFADVHV